MKLTNFVEIERANSIGFHDKFFVKILSKEKMVNLKKNQKKDFSLWKFFIFDPSGTIEVFSEDALDLQEGNIVEISNIKIIYHRGKIKIFGTIKEPVNFSKISKFPSHNSKKNFSIYNRTKNFFSFRKKIF